METKISNYGVINPKIYLREPRKMLKYIIQIVN